MRKALTEGKCQLRSIGLPEVPANDHVCGRGVTIVSHATRHNWAILLTKLFA